MAPSHFKPWYNDLFMLLVVAKCHTNTVSCFPYSPYHHPPSVESFIDPFSFTFIQVCSVDASHYELNNTDNLLYNADGQSEPGHCHPQTKRNIPQWYYNKINRLHDLEMPQLNECFREWSLATVTRISQNS